MLPGTPSKWRQDCETVSETDEGERSESDSAPYTNAPARHDLVGHSDLGRGSQQRPVGGRQEERTLIDHETVPARREYLSASTIGGSKAAIEHALT
jgi:hypothetical protein